MWALKHQLLTKAPKTVNNVLTTLNVLLKTAVEWGVTERMRCTIRLLPIAKPSMGFHDFEDYERLVAAAEVIDWQTHVIVLLGGEAGLRCGEMMALQWDDVDFAKRQLCIQRSTWKGHTTVPKGGRLRYVPMTSRLTRALERYRHLRNPLVLCDAGATQLTQRLVQGFVLRAARRANVKHVGVHVLRHHADSRIMPTAPRHRLIAVEIDCF